MNKIDKNFVDLLLKYPDKGSEKLKDLSKKELKEITKILNCPIRSNALKKEYIHYIKDYLHSERRWNVIVDG